MSKQKAEIITFKVDASLLEALQGMSNRSEFIRGALLRALDSVCPICKGSGILTPNQKRHWNAFAEDHALRECDECHEFRLVCEHTPRRNAHRAGTARARKT